MNKNSTDLKTKILEEDIKAKNELEDKLSDLKINGNVGCIDPKTQFKGDWNPPGGAQFIDRQGKLKDWMKSKKKGVLGIHVGCTGQYFVVGLTSEIAQRQAIVEFKTKVDRLNQDLETDFKVIIEEVGSAKDLLS